MPVESENGAGDQLENAAGGSLSSGPGVPGSVVAALHDSIGAVELVDGQSASDVRQMDCGSGGDVPHLNGDAKPGCGRPSLIVPSVLGSGGLVGSGRAVSDLGSSYQVETKSEDPKEVSPVPYKTNLGADADIALSKLMATQLNTEDVVSQHRSQHTVLTRASLQDFVTSLKDKATISRARKDQINQTKANNLKIKTQMQKIVKYGKLSSSKNLPTGEELLRQIGLHDGSCNPGNDVIKTVLEFMDHSIASFKESVKSAEYLY